MTTQKREWVFFRNFGGCWCWEVRENGSMVRECARDFPTREQCIADAARNGFALDGDDMSDRRAAGASH
jgi:hypothetical protein